jgi:uncharacterized membrane protein
LGYAITIEGSEAMNRRLSWKKLALLMAMSIVGLWASSMVLIIYNTLHQTLPVCSSSIPVGGIQINCEKVLSSAYSQVFGIPLEVFAVAYFAVNLALVYVYAFASDGVSRNALKVLFGWRFFGLGFVPYLMIVEFLIVKAICVYCTTMHAAIIIDFVVITYLLFWKDSSLERVPFQSDTPSQEYPAL